LASAKRLKQTGDAHVASPVFIFRFPFAISYLSLQSGSANENWQMSNDKWKIINGFLPLGACATTRYFAGILPFAPSLKNTKHENCNKLVAT
jgi:hypothetical protein